MRRRAAALVVLALLVQAGATMADPGATASLAQSERLEVFALGRALERAPQDLELAQDLRAGLTRLGFYHAGPPALVHADLSVAPFLRHDPNVNGGLPGDSLTIGGFVFTLDPSRRARSATVAGFAVDADLRLAWAEGRMLSLALAGQAGGALDDDAMIAGSDATLCLQTHIAGWIFADLCHSRTTVTRDLVSAQGDSRELRLVHLWAAGDSQHELALSLADDGTRRAGVSVESLWSGMATRAALTLSEPAATETGWGRALSLDLRWLQGGRTTGLRLIAAQSPEGGFLGLPRQEDRLSLALTRELPGGISLSGGISRTDSTVDIFDDTALSLSVSFDLD